MKRLLILVGAGIMALILPFYMSQTAMAAIDLFTGCDGISGDATCDTVDRGGATGVYGAAGVIGNIITGLLWLVGSLSVIMIIYGGLRFLFSRGDQAAVQSGKNIVLYAVIGLVVTLLAWVITGFVAGRL